MKKTTKCKEKVLWKSAETAISGIFKAFSAGKDSFSKIGISHILGIANARLCAKNQKNLMMKCQEKAKKNIFRHISVIFGRKFIFFRKSGSVTFRAWPFWIVVPKIRKTEYTAFGSINKNSWSNRILSIRLKTKLLMPLYFRSSVTPLHMDIYEKDANKLRVCKNSCLRKPLGVKQTEY